MCVCTKMKRRGLIAHGPGIKQYLHKLSTFWALSSFSKSSKKAFKNSCHGIGVEVLLRTNSLLQGCLRKSDPFALWAGITCEVLQGSVVGLVLSYPQMIWKAEQTKFPRMQHYSGQSQQKLTVKKCRRVAVYRWLRDDMAEEVCCWELHMEKNQQ